MSDTDDMVERVARAIADKYASYINHDGPCAKLMMREAAKAAIAVVADYSPSALVSVPKPSDAATKQVWEFRPSEFEPTARVLWDLWTLTKRLDYLRKDDGDWTATHSTGAYSFYDSEDGDFYGEFQPRKR